MKKNARSGNYESRRLKEPKVFYDYQYFESFYHTNDTMAKPRKILRQVIIAKRPKGEGVKWGLASAISERVIDFPEGDIYALVPMAYYENERCYTFPSEDHTLEAYRKLTSTGFRYGIISIDGVEFTSNGLFLVDVRFKDDPYSDDVTLPDFDIGF